MCELSTAQCDAAFPLTVTLKVTKEYSLKFPKSYFWNEIENGEFNIKDDSANEKQYDVEVTLKNISTEPIFIWLMTCSWMENFEINNNYIHWGQFACFKNIPVLVKFKPDENKIYKTTLSKSIKFENPCENCIYGPQVETTKLGLIIIDDFYNPKLNEFPGYELAMEDKSGWKIVWSNPVYLLNNTETSR
jgi:hypothetical protein